MFSKNVSAGFVLFAVLKGEASLLVLILMLVWYEIGIDVGIDIGTGENKRLEVC